MPTDLTSTNRASATGTGATPVASTPPKNDSKSSQALGQLSSDLNFFLRLLTTQLQNQDPTEPVDNAQLTQQIAQYSGVEQQVQTNSNLEKLLSQQTQSQLSTAVSYIGKEVETEGNTGTLDQGQAVFSFTLNKQATSSKITITNDKGQAVYQGNGPVRVGRNTVIWDGVSSFDGSVEPSGTYTISVEATNEKGEKIDAKAFAVGVVNAVETDKDGNIKLSVGDTTFDYSSIVAVRERTPIIGTNNASSNLTGNAS